MLFITKIIKKIIIITLLFLCNSNCLADTISITDYLRQVKNSNMSLKSSDSSLESSGIAKDSLDMSYSPYLFSEVNYVNDEGPRTNSLLQGDRTKSKQYVIGVSKKTRFGLNSKLSYNINDVSIKGLDSNTFPINKYSRNSLDLELSQNLWKNSFGKKDKSLQQAANYQSAALELSQEFNKVSILADAESKFWQLALIRKINKVQLESLDRARKILDYTKDRYDRNLVDEADVLQAQAGYELRKLESESIKTAVKSAEIEFNAARGINSAIVAEKLSFPKYEKVLELDIPARPQFRKDIAAAKKIKEAKYYELKSNLEDTKPALDLVGGVSLAGLDENFSNAMSDSFSSKKPTYKLGIRFSIPLDRTTVKSLNAGRLAEFQSADYDFKDKYIKQELTWDNLTTKFVEAKAKLKIATKLQRSQRKKLKNEKEIQKKGRSTTYQVLLFEQDYLSSQITKLNLMQEVLILHSRLKTFGA